MKFNKVRRYFGNLGLFTKSYIWDTLYIYLYIANRDCGKVPRAPLAKDRRWSKYYIHMMLLLSGRRERALPTRRTVEIDPKRALTHHTFVILYGHAVMELFYTRETPDFMVRAAIIQSF